MKQIGLKTFLILILSSFILSSLVSFFFFQWAIHNIRSLMAIGHERDPAYGVAFLAFLVSFFIISLFSYFICWAYNKIKSKHLKE